jgi:hypothetical protein
MTDIEIGSDENPPIEAVPEEEVKKGLLNGTILEAAFVDPAYPWPPIEGQGKNAIELKANPNLLTPDVTEIERPVSSTVTTAVNTPTITTKTTSAKSGKKCLFGCRKGADQAVVTEKEQQTAVALQAATDEKKRQAMKVVTDDQKREERYNRVPEGILIYRLNTSNHTLTLVSPPSTHTDRVTLIESMIIASAKPSTDKSRRGIDMVGIDGTKSTLIACEQRTAIAWCEAMDMMMGNKERSAAVASGKKVWSCFFWVFLSINFLSILSHSTLCSWWPPNHLELGEMSS